MSGTFLPLLVVLLLIASFLRGDFALTLIYLVVGALAASVWWSNRGLAQVKTSRRFSTHAFLGERIKVSLRVKNSGWLPLPWLEIRETLPVELVGPNSFQSVVHLGAGEAMDFEYSVEARKRGYYPIGPLSFSTGDILGLKESVQSVMQAEHLVVYPKIIPFPSMNLPSRSPQGTLRHALPLFEDPAKVFGKRGYISGDSLRRVDWKSSAVTGNLQVKVFEPSIALETCLILNLNAEDYYFRSRIDSTELAVVIAASIANWIVENKQIVGLLVNGRDPLTADSKAHIIPAHKGKSHLMRVLELLARVERTDASPLIPLIQRQRFSLGWGTTLVVITGNADEQLIHELYQARRAGQNVVLILVGSDGDEKAHHQRARTFGIPLFAIASERDLQMWMQGSKLA
jgi:uncharacterized protein (DUF58 family)